MYVPKEIGALVVGGVKTESDIQLSPRFLKYSGPRQRMLQELHLLSRRILTILVMDIANFTTICENISARELLSLMSEYLRAMCSLISASDGTLDKV